MGLILNLGIFSVFLLLLFDWPYCKGLNKCLPRTKAGFGSLLLRRELLQCFPQDGCLNMRCKQTLPFNGAFAHIVPMSGLSVAAWQSQGGSDSPKGV